MTSSSGSAAKRPGRSWTASTRAVETSRYRETLARAGHRVQADAEDPQALPVWPPVGVDRNRIV